MHNCPLLILNFKETAVENNGVNWPGKGGGGGGLWTIFSSPMSLGDVSGVAKSSILMSSLSFFFFCLAPATLINEQMIIKWTCKFQEWSASIDGRLNYNSIYKFLKNGERHHQWTKTNNLLCFKFILLWLFWFALLFCGWLLMLKLNKRNIHKS